MERHLRQTVVALDTSPGSIWRPPQKARKNRVNGFEKSWLGAWAASLSGTLLPVNFSKLILGIYAALFVAVTLWAGSFFVQMHRDYVTLKAQETANQRRLTEAEARLQAQEKYPLDQLRHDPVLVERIHPPEARLTPRPRNLCFALRIEKK